MGDPKRRPKLPPLSIEVLNAVESLEYSGVQIINDCHKGDSFDMRRALRTAKSLAVQSYLVQALNYLKTPFASQMLDDDCGLLDSVIDPFVRAMGSHGTTEVAAELRLATMDGIESIIAQERARRKGLDIQPATMANATKSPSIPIEHARETRLQEFIANNPGTSVADVGRAASVFKANMQQWRRGELPDSSVMSERIEDVFIGKRPIVRLGKKKG